MTSISGRPLLEAPRAVRRAGLPLARAAVLSATLVVSASCGGAAVDAPGAVRAEVAGGDPAAGAATVRVAAWPPDACGWLPAEAVEALVGPLAGPPRAEGTACRYLLPLDSATARNLQRGRELERELLGLDAASLGRTGPDEAAVIVDVDLAGGVLEERTRDMAAEAFEEVLGAGAVEPTVIDPAAPSGGWDYESAPLGRLGFTGRVGHVKVTVTRENVDVPLEALADLAAQVRDRVPDLPFPFPAPGVTLEPTSEGRDPCGLLTPAEAAAALGPLVVPPYRSRDGGPFIDGRGGSCAYFTAGHRVLVLTPEWTYGKSELAAVRSVAGLTAAVVIDYEAEAADTLDGPWDDVAAVGATGEMYFLKGIRLLRLGYGASATDAAGAVALARIAVERLAR